MLLFMSRSIQMIVGVSVEWGFGAGGGALGGRGWWVVGWGRGAVTP